MRVKLLRLEPGHAEFVQLREDGDIETLAGYVNDPKSSRRLRRHAVTYIASAKKGGGKANLGTGSTDPSVVPFLTPLLEKDHDRSVRRTAAYGLRRTGDQSAMPALLHALSDTDKATRIHAAMGLGDLQARAAVEPLSELLNDRGCAKAAARALVDIGDERALDPLKGAASSTRSRRQREKFTQAIIDLERRVGLLPME